MFVRVVCVDLGILVYFYVCMEFYYVNILCFSLFGEVEEVKVKIKRYLVLIKI